MLTPTFEVLDPRFARYAPGNVHLEKLFTGCRWAEGPVYVPAGRYLLDWEQTALDRVVTDLFGFHALQLGLPSLQGLRTNRMPHRWLAVEHADEFEGGQRFLLGLSSG